MVYLLYPLSIWVVVIRCASLDDIGDLLDPFFDHVDVYADFHASFIQWRCAPLRRWWWRADTKVGVRAPLI